MNKTLIAGACLLLLAAPAHGRDLLIMDVDQFVTAKVTDAIEHFGGACHGGPLVWANMENGDWWISCPLDVSPAVYVWDHVGDFYEYASWSDAHKEHID